MPSNVQLKGQSAGDPWWVIEGTPGEIVSQIAQVFPDLAVTTPEEFPSAVAKAREAWAAQMTVGNTLGGAEVRHEVPASGFPGPQAAAGFSPAPSASAAPAQGAPAGATIESDRWGNSYEIGRPDAPMTQYGPAVLKHGKSQAGKPYKRWIDPRSKVIPSVYASGVRSDPADLWPGDWAK